MMYYDNSHLESISDIHLPLCPFNLHKCLKVPSLCDTNSMVCFHEPEI